LLAHWASRGWLSRIRRGMYITVPLDAVNPGEWRKDPWIIASTLFSPCYIGGWSAAEYWGLTEQIFADIIVFTSSRERRRCQVIKGTTYLLATTSDERMFGLSSVWRDTVRIHASSPARTVIDILDKPKLGGGIKHVAHITGEFFTGEHRDDKTLMEYAQRVGNKTVCKRLGYIVETLKIDATDVVSFCRHHISTGYSKLDPGITRKGRLLRRWKLEVNADVGEQGDRA
jgi:predicted transcriptional regulator of viral defense system